MTHGADADAGLMNETGSRCQSSHVTCDMRHEGIKDMSDMVTNVCIVVESCITESLIMNVCHMNRLMDPNGISV